jgi:N-acetylmuramoyl-L-alanine amidase
MRVPRIASRVESQGSLLARLTIDIAPATPHAVSQDSSRLLIRFEADSLDATLPSSTVPDLIQNVHPGDGPAVIVVDLGPRFASYRASDFPGDAGSGRLVIDVTAQTTEGQPAAQPQAQPAPQEAPPLLELNQPGGLRTIVVDAGHGGEEDGAHGKDGTLEKTVTLTVARRLKAALEARLGARVILTRDSDQTVGLDERAAVANNNKADLFVSLHANASVRPAMSGAEVFYLSLAEYGEQAQRVAHGESEALPVFARACR